MTLTLYRRRIIRLVRQFNIPIMVIVIILLFSYTFFSTSKRTHHPKRHHNRHPKGRHSHRANNPDDLLDGMVPEHLDHHDIKDDEPLPGEFKPKRALPKTKKEWFELWNREIKRKPLPKKRKPSKKKSVVRQIIAKRKLSKKSKIAPSQEKVALYSGENDKGIEVDKETLLQGVKFPPFIKYGKPGDPGEMGRKFKIDTLSLKAEEIDQKNLDFKKHYFDVWVSQRIAIHRTLEDTRPPACRNKDITNFPSASIIIVFYNEAWTVLLRTLHSILDRTPPQLLKEIILLDDFSDMDHLKLPLQGYVQRMKKVRLIRAPGRIGLIRARNAGVSYATGDTVVFLDSHVECFEGWLEPLLEVIHKDSRTIAYPLIEYISASTFGLRMSDQPGVVGGFFSHTLTFNWLYERKLKIVTRTENHPSPTMPGGLYAISKDWFLKLGGYDPGLQLWGGENMEMSFKAWMCGGSILLVSCSHVGHVFRTKNPALMGTRVNTVGNSIRVAEVWLDSYKHFYYERIGYHLGKYGDVSARKELKKKLHCHNFGWYLDNVYPEMKADMDTTTVYGGRIIHSKTGLCLEKRSKIFVDKCLGYVYIQMWQVTKWGQIQSGDKILGVMDFPKKGAGIIHSVMAMQKSFLSPSLNTGWQYDAQSRIVHVKTGLCLIPKESKAGLEVVKCSDSDNQIWKIDKRKDTQDAMKDDPRIDTDWDE